jgi:hypothetical protein
MGEVESAILLGKPAGKKADRFKRRNKISGLRFQIIALADFS